MSTDMQVAVNDPIDHLPIGVFTIDADGTIDRWNRTLERWTGLRSGDVHGQSLFRCFPNLSARRFRLNPYREWAVSSGFAGPLLVEPTPGDSLGVHAPHAELRL